MRKHDLILIGVFVAAMTGINIGLVAFHRLPWGGVFDSRTFGVMVAAALTVALFSQLYSDNALFKVAESIFVGTSVGYALTAGWYNIWVTEIISGLRSGASTQQLGVWSIILPSILGLMIYARLSRRQAWISRIPFALMIGFGMGFAIPTTISANLLKQLEPMFVDLFHDPDGTFAIQWNRLVILVGVFSTLMYFFFSIEHKGIAGRISKVGIWFLMVAFGASFGYAVMARLSLLIGRVDFLFRDWLTVIH